MGHPLKQSGLLLINLFSLFMFMFILFFFGDRLYLCVKIAFKYAFFPVQLVLLFSVSQLP